MRVRDEACTRLAVAKAPETPHRTCVVPKPGSRPHNPHDPDELGPPEGPELGDGQGLPETDASTGVPGHADVTPLRGATT